MAETFSLKSVQDGLRSKQDARPAGVKPEPSPQGKGASDGPQPAPRPMAPTPAQPRHNAPQRPAPRPAPAQASSDAARPAPVKPPAAANARAMSHDAMSRILLDMGVSPADVAVSLRRAKETGESLAQIMRDFGFLSGEGVAQAVSKLTGFEYFPFEAIDAIERQQLADIRIREFRRFIPVGRDPDGTLIVAVPDASVIVDAQNQFFEAKNRPVIASEHTIQTVYRKLFSDTEGAFDAVYKRFLTTQGNGRRSDDDGQAAGLVQDIYFSLLRHACYAGASDLYLYKSEHVGIVKVKVNGVGQIFRTIDVTLYDRLLNKLVQDNSKADDLKLRPKEAVVEFSDADREKYPDIATRFGFRLQLSESRNVRTAVIRILDKNAPATDLDRLGFDKHTHELISRVSRTSHGFFLVTGPTGSGKTTSLYAMLKSINAVERSIQSIEDPIEYRHGLWQQFELRKSASNKAEEYNEWLKALLRNAPDVILVGEVRDSTVAEVCLNAANTGHLVFATLHTNDAVTAIARLKSLKVDIDILGSVLLGVLAQRLVRTLCKDCKVEDASVEVREALASLKDRAGEPAASGTYRPYKAGAGCPNCEYTGYRGRRMVYEVLQVNQDVRAALETGAPLSAIARAGMQPDQTMWSCGLRLVREGVTSLQELQLKVTPPQ